MSILFISDFDNTLGDVYGVYGEGNIFRTQTLDDTQLATQIYDRYRRGPDDILMYDQLIQAYGIDDRYTFFQQGGISDQLYDDVVPFFRLLQDRSGMTIALLSTGDERFQSLKISLTGIDAYVDEVYLTRDRDKIRHIRLLHEKYAPDYTVFVDDRIHMTEQDFDFPISIYEMDRSGEKHARNTIHTLYDLSIILDDLVRLYSTPTDQN